MVQTKKQDEYLAHLKKLMGSELNRIISLHRIPVCRIIITPKISKHKMIPITPNSLYRMIIIPN